MLTLSKRAVLLARALEVVSPPQGAAAAAAGAAAAQGTGAGALERGPVVRWAGVTLSALVAAARGMEAELVVRVEAAGTEQEEEGEPWGECAGSGGSGGGGGGGGSGSGRGIIEAWGVVSACECEAHEALALAARAASNLAALFAWQLAADVRTAADSAIQQDGKVVSEVLRAVGDLLFLLVGCCRHPAPLPPAQLLACQPHRLLAAACALAATAMAEEKKNKKRELRGGKRHLCPGLACLLVALSSHEVLSGRVRGWLAPPHAAICRRRRHHHFQYVLCWLAACVEYVMQLARSLVPVHAAHGLALLRMAAEGGTKGNPGRAAAEEGPPGVAVLGREVSGRRRTWRRRATELALQTWRW